MFDGKAARLLAQQETVAFRLVCGDAGTMTRAEILMHIVNHATYHRGWVSDLFFQVPAKPPTTDWNVFLGLRARSDA